MSDVELRVPLGIAENGVPVYPHQAQRHVSYTCPECHVPLTLRAGPLKRPHFAHRRTPDECGFLNEGWLHIAAKWAVWGAVHQWILSDRKQTTPSIFRKCEGHFCPNTHSQAIPDTVETSQIEFPFNTPVGRVVLDVALLGANGRLLCAIEIRDTHAVDSEKRTKLRGIPWIELDARHALEHPQMWEPVASGNLKTPLCPQCREKMRRAIRIPVRRRGLALHVDACPAHTRSWRGKSYANVLDDCTGCPYCAHLDAEVTEMYAGPVAVWCAYHPGDK